jgi:hypothetical protein
MLRRLFPILTACFLAACSGDSSITPDHKALESPTGEAVLRHLLSLCPHRTEAKQLTIVLGPLQDSASPEFETKFADTGLIVTPSRKLVAGAVNGEVRIFDGSTNQAPIILQLSSLTPEASNPANYEAIAAWAWKDKAQRLKLRVLTKPDAAPEIRQIEEIPIPVRNQDGMPTPPAADPK